MTLWGTIAGLAMAFGAPLVYAEQAWSIQKKRDSAGFSKDVCAVLLIANLARCWFWLAKPFELVLLLQSILMIAAQIYLLSLLLKYRPGSYAHASFTASSDDHRRAQVDGPVAPIFDAETAATQAGPSAAATAAHGAARTAPSAQLTGPAAGGKGRYTPLMGLEFPAAPTLGLDESDDAEEDQGSQHTKHSLLTKLKASWSIGEGVRADGSSGSRPFGFWTWLTLPPYILFLLALCVFLGIFHVSLGWSSTYVATLGYFALGLESTLPIPQAIENQRRKSLSGFRYSVLLGWALGDTFKLAYFLAGDSPVQFTVCAVFQLSVDVVIVVQAYVFREQTMADDEVKALQQAEAMAAREAERGEIRDAPSEPEYSNARGRASGTSGTTPAKPARAGKAAGSDARTESGSTYATVEADSSDDDNK